MRKDGEIRHLEVFRKEVLWNGKTQFQVLYNDITERRQAEQTLEESEERFRHIVENAPAGYYRVGKDGLWQYVNPKWESMHGLSSAEVAGKPFEITQPPDSVDQARDIVRRSLAWETVTGVFGRLRKDGPIGYHTFNVQPVYRGNEIVAIEGFISDITERKQAEEALLESNKRFTDIAENALEWIWEVDTDGKYTYSGPVVERILGYEPQQVLKMYFYDLFHPDDREEMKKAAFEAFAKKQPFRQFLNRNMHKSGKTIWLSTSGVPLLDKEGNLLGYRGVDVDITERKQAEEELRRKEEYFRSLIENAADAISILNADGTIVYQSPSYLRVLGYVPEEEVGRNMLDNIHPDDVTKVSEDFARLLQDPGYTTHFEVRVRARDGSWRVLEGVARNLLHHPAVAGIVVNLRDVTDHKKAEEALRESEEKLRLMFESVDDGIAVTELQGFTIIEANQRLADIHGFRSKKHMIGKGMPDLMDPSDNEKAMISIRKIMEEGADRNVEYTLIRADGSRFPAEINTRLLKDGKGNPVGLISSTRDITERKTSELKLQESENKFRALVETTSDFIWELNLQGVYNYCSPQIERLWGLKPQEMLGKTPFDLLPTTEDREQAIKAFSVLLESASPFTNMEVRSFDGAGQVRLLEISGVPFFDKEGKLCGYRGISRDITERKRMGEALRAERDRLYNVLEVMPMMVCLLSPDYHVVFANRAFREKFGESHGRHCYEYCFGKKEPCDFCESYTVLKTGKPHRWEVTSQDGSTIIDAYDFPFVDADGSDLILEVDVDITERKKAEAKIRQSEEKLRSIVENSSDQIFMLDKDYKFLSINKTAADISMKSPQEMIGMSIFEVFPEETAVRFSKNVKNVFDTGESISIEEKMVVQGREFWNSTSLNPIMDDKGNVIAVTGIVRDITEQKKAEDDLRRSEEVFRNVFENSPIGMFRARLDGSEVLEANERFQEILGYTRQEVVGKPSVIYWANPHQREEMVRRVKADGRVTDFDCQLFTKNGEVRECALSAVVYAESGILEGSIRDLTVYKQLGEQRQRAEKLESVGTLAGGIAHDFNNILTAILGNVQLAGLYMKTSEVDEAQEMLLEAERASLRARDLTQQLLTFSRGGAPVRKVVLLSQFIKDTASFALRGSKVKAEFSVADNLWAVEADEGQIGQAISNIVINADQAMPSGGIINIRARNIVAGAERALPLPLGDYIEIAIEDHGTGIPRSHFDKIFDPYFTTKQKGSGLGLATTYSIIKNHDGHIDFESELGVGTTFRLYLPAAKEKVKKEEEVSVQPLPPGQGRILVMDDEEGVRMFLNRLLESAGYKVELTEDGAEAIKRYTEAKKSGQPFDAVILELTVPGGMGGKEVVAKLLEIDPEVKAIVSSGYATDPIMAEFQKYGFKGVVTKPYDIRQMQQTLHDVLAQK